MSGQGRPARELSDAELEHQGTQAHATRNRVFLHGTAAQFANHTARMMELEQEYLRRYPQRTWEGSGGAPSEPGDALEELKTELGGIMDKLELHQAARECGVSRETLASLYTSDDPLIAAEKADRTITAQGRERIGQ